MSMGKAKKTVKSRHKKFFPADVKIFQSNSENKNIT